MHARDRYSPTDTRNGAPGLCPVTPNARDDKFARFVPKSPYPWPEIFEDRYPTTTSLGIEEHPQDRLGDDAVKNDPVWHAYRDRATKLDDELFASWKDSLDILLVFAGLLSAISTAFMIEAQKLLRPDWYEVAARVSYAQWSQAGYGANSTIRVNMPPDLDSFQPEARVVWANRLWSLSLMLCLTAALLGILSKQWISEYRSRARAGAASHQRWAWRHQVLNEGIRRFKLSQFIRALPMTLYLAIFAFLAGLCLFLVQLDGNLAITLGTATTVLATAHVLVTILLPFYFPQLPPMTPLLEPVQYKIMSAYQSVVRRLHKQRLIQPSSSEPAWRTTNLNAYQEQRLLRPTKSRHQRDRDALLWMVENPHDVNDVSSALEAIGRLPLLEYRGVFSAQDIRAFRDLAVMRNSIWARRGRSSASDAECAGLLRTCAVLVAVGDEIDRTTILGLETIQRCSSISTYDVPFLYQSIVRDERGMLNILDGIERWWCARGAIEAEPPAQPSSLALWTTSAIEHLLLSSSTRGSSSVDHFSLGRLATLLRCIITVSSAANAQEILGGPDADYCPSDRAAFRMRQEAGYARLISRSAGRRRLMQSHHEIGAFAGAEQYLSTGTSPSIPWILESLSIWGSLLSDHSAGYDHRCDIQTLDGLYSALLAHVSARTVPISSTKHCNLAIHALNYLTTPYFRRSSWTAAALLGPLDMTLRLVQQMIACDGDAHLWTDTTMLLAHLFAYVAEHDDLVRNGPLSQILMSTVDLLEKLRVRRDPFSIYNALSNHFVGEGDIPLLYAPDNGRIPSIWHSACRIRAIAGSRYNQTMLEAATSIGLHLSRVARQSVLQRASAEEIMRDLLAPDDAITMLREDHGQMLNLYLRQISPALSEEAVQRLAVLNTISYTDIRIQEDGMENTADITNEQIVTDASEHEHVAYWTVPSAPLQRAADVKLAPNLDSNRSDSG